MLEAFVGLLGFCVKSFPSVGILCLNSCCKLVRPLFFLFLLLGFLLWP